MKLTGKQISSLLQKKEGERVEFKRATTALPDNTWDSYSAFCNTDGGVIILGVAEGKPGCFSIEGVKNAQKLMSDFWSTANNVEKVSYSIFFGHYVYPVKCGNKTVVVIEVPRAPREARPVYIGEDVFKGSFRRNGEGDYHCTREAVKAMLRDQCNETADMCVLDELLVTDLNADTIRRYRGRFSNIKVGHVWNDLPDDEFLTKIGAARQCADGKVHPTLAGLVCFGDFVTIMHVLPNYFLDYRERLSRETRWNDRVAAHDATWSGNIYDFYMMIYDPDRVKITVYTDPVQGTANRPKSAPKTAQSAPRVPQIDPSFAQNRPKPGAESAQAQSAIGPRQDGFEQSFPLERRDEIASVRQVYKAIVANPKATYRGLAAQLDFAKDTIGRAIATLIRLKIIRREGNKQTGHWEVVK